MSDRIYLGKNAKEFFVADKFEPYSKVIVNVDENNYFVAGDDTGRTLEVDIPWGTQQIADNLLEQYRGFAYLPYEAEGALIDPAAEIGDGVTFRGEYGGLYSQDIEFDHLHASTISAENDEQIDHEFPFEEKKNREIVRKIADAKASIETTINSITLTVVQADGTKTEIKLAEGGEISLEGVVKFSNLATAGETTINGSNIKTGTLNADLISAGTLKADRIVANSISTAQTNASINGSLGNADYSAGVWGGWNFPSYCKATNIGLKDSTSISANGIYGKNFYVDDTYIGIQNMSVSTPSGTKTIYYMGHK